MVILSVIKAHLPYVWLLRWWYLAEKKPTIDKYIFIQKMSDVLPNFYRSVFASFLLAIFIYAKKNFSSFYFLFLESNVSFFRTIYHGKLTVSIKVRG